MSNIEAVLFDLDDTLLGNNMDEFLPHYFSALTEYVQPFLSPDKFMKELLYSTQAMIKNGDPSRTNREVFWSLFCQRTGLDQDIIEPYLGIFYQETFPLLRDVTELRPIARTIVNYCLDYDLKVVVATNPLFPLQAIKHRLTWAGIPADQIDFDLITAYENMHSAKPNLAYYEEILEIIDVEASKALMVGDDWENDMLPANELGLHTYWIGDTITEGPQLEFIDDCGSLEHLFELLSAGWLMTRLDGH
jgi:FMN phosphatase YigB (HAD superfamily)